MRKISWIWETKFLLPRFSGALDYIIGAIHFQWACCRSKLGRAGAGTSEPFHSTTDTRCAWRNEMSKRIWRRLRWPRLQGFYLIAAETPAWNVIYFFNVIDAIALNSEQSLFRRFAPYDRGATHPLCHFDRNERSEWSGEISMQRFFDCVCYRSLRSKWQ